MIRLTFYIILAVALAYCAALISSYAGQVLITGQGWEIRFSTAILVVLVILYTLLIWFVSRLIKWLNIASLFNSPQRLAAKREKAEADIDLAWSALVLEDYDEAIKLGKRAKSKLGNDHNVLRLLATASQYKGEKQNPYLETLKISPQSATWVQKKELDLLMQQKSWNAASDLVKTMLLNHPKNPLLLGLRYSLAARLGQWQEAYEYLQDALSEKGAIKAEDKGHLKAVLEYCLALEEKAAGKRPESLTKSKTALKNDATFSPAAALAARVYIEQGDKKSAEKILNTIWKVAPNKEIAEMISDLYPQESATETFRRIQKLSSGAAQNSADNQHLIAKIALDAKHWPEARKALELLITAKKATKTTYLLLAELERKQKNDEQAANKFVEKAEKASRDSRWQCNQCKTTLTHYKPVCTNCHDFDSVNWTNT